MNNLSEQTIKKLKAELERLNESSIEVDGKQVKPGNCFYFDANPPHVLYNTNCPQSLKEKVQEIISKYISIDESSTY